MSSHLLPKINELLLPFTFTTIPITLPSPFPFPLPSHTLLLLTVLPVLLLLVHITRRLYFHPLSPFPGPPLWALSQIPLAYNVCQGRLNFRVAALHEKYGPVVRIAPNELSFIDEEAWEGIYAWQKGRGQIKKDEFEFRPEYKDGGVGKRERGILFERDDGEHGRIRRNFSHAFSSASLRAQEPLLTQYIDVLIQRFREHAQRGEAVNVCAWFNYATFDVVGDLVFGQSFECLENERLHWWIKKLFDYVFLAAMHGALRKLGPLTKIIEALVPKTLLQGEQAHKDMTSETLDKRLAMKEPRADFLSHVQKSLGTETGVSYTELLSTSRILIIGGSETTATLLSGITYFLLTHPPIYHKLVSEIRSAFATEEDITMQGIGKLDYQLAIINEALRLFPPIPGLSPRVSPPQGCTIAGYDVPGNVTVGIDLWAAGHSNTNFHRAYEFIPERWLPAPLRPAEFANDKRGASQAFSVGPRNCIGKRLAYTEIGMVLARVLWGFDLSFEGEEGVGDAGINGGKGKGREWMDKIRVFGFYEKGVLGVRMHEVVR